MLKRISGVQAVEVGERVCLVVGASRNNATLVFCWDAARGTFSEPRLLATGCSVKVRGKVGKGGEERRKKMG